MVATSRLDRDGVGEMGVCLAEGVIQVTVVEVQDRQSGDAPGHDADGAVGRNVEPAEQIRLGDVSMLVRLPEDARLLEFIERVIVMHRNDGEASAEVVDANVVYWFVLDKLLIKVQYKSITEVAIDLHQRVVRATLQMLNKITSAGYKSCPRSLKSVFPCWLLNLGKSRFLPLMAGCQIILGAISLRLMIECSPFLRIPQLNANQIPEKRKKHLPY